MSIPLMGKCYKCQGEDYPLTKWGGHYYCKFCLVVAKDSTKGKINKLEKPVDDFQKLIRKTV